jgi:hypothetical protein
VKSDNRPARDAGTKKEYIQTGVHGLNHVLCGGFLREGFDLLEADVRSSQTIVAHTKNSAHAAVATRGVVRMF